MSNTIQTNGNTFSTSVYDENIDLENQNKNLKLGRLMFSYDLPKDVVLELTINEPIYNLIEPFEIRLVDSGSLNIPSVMFSSIGVSQSVKNLDFSIRFVGHKLKKLNNE